MKWEPCAGCEQEDGPSWEIECRRGADALAKNAARQALFERLLEVLGNHELSAAEVGQELWMDRRLGCCLANPQRWTLPASRLLHRAAKRGLVKRRDDGRRWLWRKA